MKQPTKDSIKKAHSEGCSDVKKVIENLWPEEFNVEFVKGKIYAIVADYKIYKLQDIGDKWMFCRMGGSDGGSCGKHDHPETAISKEGDIKIFDSEVEFYRWAIIEAEKEFPF